jgi:zinc protease
MVSTLECAGSAEPPQAAGIGVTARKVGKSVDRRQACLLRFPSYVRRCRIVGWEIFVIFEKLALGGTIRAVVALALAFTPAAALSDAPKANGWGIPYTDVTPDPSVRYGTLPNGMKYAIMRNATPKGAASVRMQIAFGSIAENDREQGLAHFIEHMAFNGTTHVPEGDMIKILQRQGLAFGADTNAMTGFDTTTYMLELPKADAEHLDTAMFLLREVASEVKFAPDAVDRERGVILGEKRVRDNFQLRQAIDVIGFRLPDTPYGKRLPIGTEEVLKTAGAEDIRSLYQRYYRPENATLIFVGDADPNDIEARIRKTFGDWKNNTTAGAPLPRGRIDTSRPAAFDTFTDPAVATTVIYTVTQPWIDPVDTLAERQRKMIRSMAVDMFNQRLQRLSNLPGSPILGGGMSLDEQKEAGRLTTVQVTGRDGAWKEALKTAEQEVRRALQYGFTATELKNEVARVQGGLRTEAEQANTRNSAALAGLLVSLVGEHEFMTTPAYRFAQFGKLLPTITTEQINAAFREAWTGSAPLVHVSSKQVIPVSDVAAALGESRKVALKAWKDMSSKTFAYDTFGKPGVVAEDKRIADLDVRTVRFANNVRLNLKKTDFEAGRIRFLVRMGNGQLDLPVDEPGLGLMMSSTSLLGALRKHNLEQLKELVAGKVVHLGTAVDDDAFITSGATTKADLALQMKLSAAFLTDPGFRPEAATQWANLIPLVEKQIDAQPQGVAGARLPILLANGDLRFGIPAEQQLAQRTFKEAQAAIKPVIASAPIEITMVGDLDEAQAIAAVAATFGALPNRQLSDDPPAAARRVSFRTDRSPIVLKHDGSPDQAMVAVVWPTGDDRDFQRMVGLGMLARVIDLMLTETIREKLGDSYGVNVANNMADAFPGFGYLFTSAIVAPDKTDEVQKAIEETASELRSKPVDSDLLARARAPALEAIDRSRRENSFWIGALAKAQSQPERLNRVRTQRALIQAITAADLQKLAQQYLTPATLQQVRIVSSKLATTAAR